MVRFFLRSTTVLLYGAAGVKSDFIIISKMPNDSHTLTDIQTALQKWSE